MYPVTSEKPPSKVLSNVLRVGVILANAVAIVSCIFLIINKYFNFFFFLKGKVILIFFTIFYLLHNTNCIIAINLMNEIWLNLGLVFFNLKSYPILFLVSQSVSSLSIASCFSVVYLFITIYFIYISL